MKGISREPTLTIHATASYSDTHWDRDRDATAHELLDAARMWIGADVKNAHIHGWRYSKPCKTEPFPYALVSAAPPLLLAGDAFGGPRVEGAALSGWAAAEALLRFASTGN
jgi:predicted NAD/FAD-dependent oxidoreductase